MESVELVGGPRCGASVLKPPGVLSFLVAYKGRGGTPGEARYEHESPLKAIYKGG